MCRRVTIFLSSCKSASYDGLSVQQLHITIFWHTFCFQFAIRNLCMTTICHVSTGSNMKHLTFYPGASPHGSYLRKRWSGLAIAIWLALFPMAIVQSQVIITCPNTITIDCSVNPVPANTGNASATTNCPFGSAIIFTYLDDDSQLVGCMGTGVLKRTWTATDLCGQAATCIQNIIIEDNTSPTLTCPSFIIISCNSDTTPATIGMAIANDNCTPQNEITITYTDHTQNLSGCNGTGSFTRHWNAIDMCGNIAACIQTIVVIDNQAPVLIVPPPVTISCEENTTVENTGAATATDNCSATPTI